MYHISEVVVVEGKYDAIRLKSVVDTMVIETDGFGLFHNKEQLALLRRLAKERGLVVLTDSDGAGFVIRNFISGVIPREQLKHAYIPEMIGKERRKSAPSKEGLLGVEGVNNAVIETALRQAGVALDEEPLCPPPFLTKADLYRDGLSGCPDSAARRKRLQAALDLPRGLSTARLVEVLNRILTPEDYRQALEKTQKSE